MRLIGWIKAQKSDKALLQDAPLPREEQPCRELQQGTTRGKNGEVEHD